MPVLLDRLPIPEVTSEVVFGGRRFRVRGNQIIVWVMVTRRRLASPDLRLVPFPAILDTGHNHTFSIQERHLVEWAGLDAEALPEVGTAREQGRRVRLHAADLWVRRNLQGFRDRLTGDAPHRVSAPIGIAIYPAALNFPRLPILGLRAIADNDLVLVVNGHRRQATLRTAYRWWPFAGR